MKLIHMWRTFIFLLICHVQKFEISPHDRFFLHGHRPCVRDKYEVCASIHVEIVQSKVCGFCFSASKQLRKKCVIFKISKSSADSGIQRITLFGCLVEILTLSCVLQMYVGLFVAQGNLWPSAATSLVEITSSLPPPSEFLRKFIQIAGFGCP